MPQASTTPSAPPAQSATPSPTAVIVDGTPIATTATAAEIYQALRAQRRELDNQLDRLRDEREDIANELREGPASDADRAGLDQRLVQVDQQIASVGGRLAEADARVAGAAGVPGATVEPPRPDPWQYGPPEEVVMMGIFFGSVLLFPIMIAFARRVWRRSTLAPALPAEFGDRLGSMERAIDAVAIEVERIGEGQRFVTQLLAERATAAGLPAGPSTGGARRG